MPTYIENLATARHTFSTQALRVQGYQNNFFNKLYSILKVDTMFTSASNTWFNCKTLRLYLPGGNDDLVGDYFIDNTPPSSDAGYFDENSNIDLRAYTWTRVGSSGTYTISYNTSSHQWELRNTSTNTLLSYYQIPTEILEWVSTYGEWMRPLSGGAIIDDYNEEHASDPQFVPLEPAGYTEIPGKNSPPLIVWSPTDPTIDGFKVAISTYSNSYYGFTPFIPSGSSVKVDWGDGNTQTLTDAVSGQCITHKYVFTVEYDPVTSNPYPKEFEVSVEGRVTQLVFGKYDPYFNLATTPTVSNEPLYWHKCNYYASYSSGTTYNLYDLVKDSSNKYWTPTENGVTGVTPSSSSTKWHSVSYEGNNDETVIYEEYDAVYRSSNVSAQQGYYLLVLPEGYSTFPGKVLFSNYAWAKINNPGSGEYMFNKCNNLSTDDDSRAASAFHYNQTNHDFGELSALTNSFTTIRYMFNTCSVATFTHISALSSGNLAYADHAFESCSAGLFTNLSTLSTGLLTANYMFNEDNYAPFAALNTIGNVQQANHMFDGCTVATFNALGSFGNALVSADYMFSDCRAALFPANINGATILPSTLTYANGMFYRCGENIPSGAEVSACNMTITKLPTNLTQADYMFCRFGGTIDISILND